MSQKSGSPRWIQLLRSPPWWSFPDLLWQLDWNLGCGFASKGWLHGLEMKLILKCQSNPVGDHSFDTCLSGNGCAFRARFSELGAATVVGVPSWEPAEPKVQGAAQGGGWWLLGYEPMCSEGRRGLNWELSCGDLSARARRDIFGAPHGQHGATAFLYTEPWAGLHCLSACPVFQHTALIPSALQGSSICPNLHPCVLVPLKIECVLKKIGSVCESNSPHTNRNVSGRCWYCLVFSPLLQKEPRWSF